MPSLRLKDFPPAQPLPKRQGQGKPKPLILLVPQPRWFDMPSPLEGEGRPKGGVRGRPTPLTLPSPPRGEGNAPRHSD